MRISLNEELKSLYTVDMLSLGYSADEEESIVKTFSFKQYQSYRPFLEEGRLGNPDGLLSISQHDACITRHLLNYLYDSNSKKLKMVVGVMGGHSEARSSRQYADVAELSRFLTQKGYMVVTGGGPGIMEAAHLGAYFCNATESEWLEVKAKLTGIKMGEPHDKIPKGDLVDKAGELLPGKEDEYRKLHAWYKFAEDLRAGCKTRPGVSLAISTWEYGQEPVMPFASAYACYFQNSIRESALVREARAGIIYARGGGGTLREIWQDVEENYYCENRDALTPMIFFDFENIWGDHSSRGTKSLDIYSTLMQVLNYRLSNKGFSWEDKIVSTVNHEKILFLLDRHTEKAKENFAELVGSGA